MKRSRWTVLVGALAMLTAEALHAQPPSTPSFSVSFPASRSSVPLDGRLILLLSTDASKEPRKQVSLDEMLKSPWMFGQTVDGLKPGQQAVMGFSAFGWPVRSLAAIKPGDYVVQVVLNRYETFHRADGATIKLPPDKGEGQDWTRKPGNFYSKPIRLHIDPAHPRQFRIVLDQEIGPIAPKSDTPFVRHVMIRSDLLFEISGVVRCISARMCLYPTDLMRIQARTFH